MRNILILLGICVLSFSTFAQDITQGSLFAVDKNGTELGSCPLNNTKVTADISGFIARVRVTQEFENTFTEPIEAVYRFPLSQNSAVDEMTMLVGGRRIRSQIMKREDARKVYETAKSEGKTAALLDQERPNIFTQAVANIMPGEKILIEISYVETLKYEDGSYEFVFPMTIGPRYNPSSVKDAAKVSPPIAETRAGHDISVEVNIDAGVPIESIRSELHRIDQVNYSPNVSKVTLADLKTIPNKDLILRYDVSGKRIEDAILTHRDERGGFFTMILQPPDKIASEDRTPKEIVFVLDTSGSMYGFPIEKAKEAMRLSLEGLYPNDTFNLITFAGDTEILFDEPVPATRENLDKAQRFLDGRSGGGGTEMMKAITAALKPSASQEHLRIVCFMTDGYIGNEDEIIAEIQKYPNARVFSFGIGNSINRFLLDKMAEAGKGEAEYVTLESDGSKAAKKFYERVRTPLLTNISIDWNGMPVADIYPTRIPDLFSAKPVVINGRYNGAASGTIRLKGTIAGQNYSREIKVNFPESDPKNDSLATLWARTRIDDLTSKSYGETAVEGQIKETDQLITQLGLEFRLLTKFTSFVVVEDRVVNYTGDSKKVEVPVQLPEGSSRETDSPFRRLEIMTSLSAAPAATQGQKTFKGTGSGSGSGSGTNFNAQYGGAVNASNISILPKSENFSSILRVTPGTRPEEKSGGFTIDGSSGAENTFIVDGQEVVNFRNGGLNNTSTPLVKGRTKTLPLPEFTAAAKTANADGIVQVQVLIDESGNVMVAKTISGHPLLRPASETAALASKFEPTKIGDKTVRVRGIISYKFGKTKVEGGTLEKMTAELSENDKKDLRAAQKLHFWLYAVVRRLEVNNFTPSDNESKFVKDGKASIDIQIKAKNAKLTDALKAAGFELTSEKGLVLTGQIPIENLAALAEIENVELVLPHI